MIHPHRGSSFFSGSTDIRSLKESRTRTTSIRTSLPLPLGSSTFRIAKKIASLFFAPLETCIAESIFQSWPESRLTRTTHWPRGSKMHIQFGKRNNNSVCPIQESQTNNKIIIVKWDYLNSLLALSLSNVKLHVPRHLVCQVFLKVHCLEPPRSLLNSKIEFLCGLFWDEESNAPVSTSTLILGFSDRHVCK